MTPENGNRGKRVSRMDRFKHKQRKGEENEQQTVINDPKRGNQPNVVHGPPRPRDLEAEVGVRVHVGKLKFTRGCQMTGCQNI